MDKIEYIYSLLGDSCAAIYMGGSRVDSVIDNPHDYDYICFSERLHYQRASHILTKHNFRRSMSQLNKPQETLLVDGKDFSQIRAYPYTKITWFSYLDSLMIKVIGKDVCPKTDIIKEHRQEFSQCLKKKAQELLDGKIKNQKRWYHILRGTYILMNNSYEVTPEQKVEINTLHDLNAGYEKLIEKTASLVKELE
ncbi:MAG: hypothetical protein J6A25_00810 [Lachnospiraceae bacterium]|nr:hypothetical protein [Lachnospiraceae bacterium]